MNVKPEVEKWKDEVMDSLRGMERAAPNPFLFTRIEARIQQAVPLTSSQLRWATIGLMVLISINVYALTKGTTVSQSTNYSLSNFDTY